MRALLSAAAVTVALSLSAGGCFSPKPPGGSYLCSAVDNECPSGQECACGLCVDRATQAACSFHIDTGATGNKPLQVAEHQSFPITINALDGSGNAASEFAGEVTLTASWGDVRPNKVKLQNGVATVDVTLNRETLPPQTANLLATFIGNTGKSGKISVSVGKFTRQAGAVIPPASKLRPFGWADTVVAQPNVLRDANGAYRMYFVGAAEAMSNASSVGIATSPDGKTWTPQPQPVISGEGGMLGVDIASPSIFQVGDQYHAVVSRGPQDGREISVGMSSDGLTGWSAYNSGMSVLKPKDCAYCNKTVDFPQVVPDPLSLDAMGKPTSWILFFNATSTDSRSFTSVSIGRAQSADGFAFTPEPAPLLSGDLTGEALLYSPRVLVDGTVFKMWYSFGRVGEIALDLFGGLDLCAEGSKGMIGYATSDDGFYWIRSPSNPVLEPSEAGWDSGDRVSLVGSVVPTDGVDPQNGIELYYTTFRRVGLFCLPNGIGKATRP